MSERQDKGAIAECATLTSAIPRRRLEGGRIHHMRDSRGQCGRDRGEFE